MVVGQNGAWLQIVQWPVGLDRKTSQEIVLNQFQLMEERIVKGKEAKLKTVQKTLVQVMKGRKKFNECVISLFEI